MARHVKPPPARSGHGDAAAAVPTATPALALDLADWGLDAYWHEQARKQGVEARRLGRVSGELGQLLEVVTVCGTVRTSLRGGWRHLIRTGQAARPAVGDWVALADVAEAGIEAPPITQLLERRTALERRAAGRPSERQVLAANVDLALLVCAAGPDVNPRRLERLAALAWGGGVEPVVVINKCDECADPTPYLTLAREAVPATRYFAVSARYGDGLAALQDALTPRQTFVLLGSSGAGKSTLVNRWVGAERQRTGPLRRDGRGRHTTTSRQLLRTSQGALVLDTPGLREIGLCADTAGLERAFPDVTEMGAACRFADCQHGDEPGCAAQQAVAEGTLAPHRLAAWRRLAAERGDSAPDDDSE